ncbi:MAG TPA: hypothetical protein DCZ72_01175 [Armatimonadetes bacterium]|nr:hypothetical protein [Armatimonadota bacterium]
MCMACRGQLLANQDHFELVLVTATPVLWGIIHRSVPNESDAEDVYQDVCEKAWKAFDLLPADSKYQAWLATIARNVTADWYRSAKRRVRPEHGYEDFIEAVPSGAAPLQRQVQLTVDLTAALEQLDDRYRLLFVHQVVYGFTQTELAETFGIALGTVKSSLSRGADKLRALMPDYVESV